MLKFSYTGRNNQGKLVEGFLIGPNKDVIASSLKKDGIIPIAIHPFKPTPNILQNTLDYLNTINKRTNLEDLILFSRQISSLTKAGVPLLRSIRVLIDSVKTDDLRLALEDVLAQLYSGQNLSVAVGKHSDIFPGLMQSLIKVGESTGNLDEMFMQAAVYLERENNTIRSIQVATRYPMFVLVAIVVAVGIINVIVVPAFLSFFSRFHAILPLPTRILIASSHFVTHYWYLILFGIISAAIAWVNYLKTEPGRMKWDYIKLKIPLAGSIIERSLLARFARSFAITSRAGLPLLDAIGIIANTTDNVFVVKRIILMRHSIEHGESLSVAAKASGMFSSAVMQMLTIGEETGEMDRLLDDVADFYERELDYDLKKLGTSIEPILIAIIAFMVLILALGVFLPMWDLSRVAFTK